MACETAAMALRPWSDVDDTAINLEKLRLLCSDKQALKRESYITASLDFSAILSKLRCQNCGKKMRPPQPLSKQASQHDIAGKKRNVCEYHPGRVINLHFTCCQAHVSIQKGCQVDFNHSAPNNYMEVLRAIWTYHSTPEPRGLVSSMPVTPQIRQRRARFTNRAAPFPRKAIALDCEFGQSIQNEVELIRMTAIDFFTKEVLIDSLVKPSSIIKNYQTRYSGVTSADMRNAVSNKSCIFGRDAARKKLLEFVNSDTILIMHGGSSDMSSLRLIHPNIIDTHILETYCEPIFGGRSLKNICEKKLNRQIQTGRGHDSHEDALACRELVVWMMNLIPDV